MKVQCGQCPAKYAVSDDRVQGRKVRIRCKRCGAAIVVDGKVDPPTVTSSPARPGAQASEPPQDRVSEAPPPELDPEPPSRPMAHTILGGLEAPVAARLKAKTRSIPPPKPPRSPPPQRAAASGDEALPRPRPGMPDPARGMTEPPKGSDPDRWRVALTKNDMRFMTTSEIAEAFRSGVIQEETFVFKKGMPSWVTLLEVPEIAEALGRPVYAPSTPPPARKPAASSGPPPRKSDAAPVGALDADNEEPLPFELVSERASSGSKGGRTSHVEDTGDAFLTLATPPPDASLDDETTGDHGSVDGSPGAATPLATNAATEPPAKAPPAADPEAPTTPPKRAADEASPVASAAGERSSAWVWIAALLLAAGAALFFLGPRFGLF